MNPVPTDVVAQRMGYKNANSGASLKTIAALTNYGLLERAGSGKLAVSSSVKSYDCAPDSESKKVLLIHWLESPAVFEKLLGKYKSGLPSDSSLRSDLLQEGFKPVTAETVLSSFKRSIEFAGYFDRLQEKQIANETNFDSKKVGSVGQMSTTVQAPRVEHLRREIRSNPGYDRIPVRLDSRRRAWLEVPEPFYEKDKQRLKDQIDFLLTDDDVEQD